MGNVVNEIQRVAGLMADIDLASGEQLAGIDQVNIAVVQMDHVTQQNAALVEQGGRGVNGGTNGSADRRSEHVCHRALPCVFALARLAPGSGDRPAAAGNAQGSGSGMTNGYCCSRRA